MNHMHTHSLGSRLRHLGSLVAFASLPLVAHGGTSIIVEDNFDRTGALVGSNADTGQTWTGSSTFSTTGTQYRVDGSSSSFATISGLTFETDSTYCLSVSIEIFLPISDVWLGLGFSRPTSTDYLTDTVGAMIRLETPEVRTYVTDSITTEQIDVVPDSFPDVLTITLDIGATLSDATLSWAVNSSPIRTGEAVDVTGIDGIFLAHESTPAMARGVFDRFELRGPIPEPSSALLLAIGGLGAVLRRRR